MMRHPMDATFEQAKAFFLQGLAHYQAGRYAAADRDFAASLALLPGRPSTLTNLGAARLKLGRADEAAAVLQDALAQEPDNAEALGHLAAAQAELGQPQAALRTVERALALQPRAGAAWTLRGTLLRELGRPAEAAAAYREALAHEADAQLVGYYLAGLGEGAPPSGAPREYVEALFDQYAGGFDDHLVHALQYRAPELLVQGLRRPRHAAALDLGCGTGLAAPLLRPRVNRLDGVDLSAQMVQRAAARGLYDAVAQDDLAQFLATTQRRYELLLAADVFIYVGELEAVFAGAARVLAAGGEFCFSVEAAGDDEGCTLRPSLRYAHSERYIRMLAGSHGFHVRACERHPVRFDQGEPVPGLFAWLDRPGPAP
jgi:predicted TPR repeat methyltransferase